MARRMRWRKAHIEPMAQNAKVRASDMTCFYRTLADQVAVSPKRGQFTGMRGWAIMTACMQFSEDFLPRCGHLSRDMGMLPADAEYRTVCATEAKMQSPDPPR